MSNQLTPQQQFEEKVKDRIRGNIGDLIPDAVLQQLIDKTMKDIFFGGKEEKDNYGRVIKVKDSWFEKEVRDLLHHRIHKMIGNYLEKHHDAVVQLVADQIKNQGPTMIANCIVELVKGIASSSSYQTTQSLTTSLMDKMRNAGINIY